MLEEKLVGIKEILKKMAKLLLFIAVPVFICVAIDFLFKDILPLILRGVLANFVIFSLVIYLVMRFTVKPVQMIEAAQDKIKTEIEESESVKKESEKNLSSIEKSMANLDSELDEILAKSKANAKLVGEKILEEASKTALIIQENTEKAIENSQIILKNDLIKRASLASLEVAKNKIIAELSSNSELHDKLIEESINALEGVEI